MFTHMFVNQVSCRIGRIQQGNYIKLLTRLHSHWNGHLSASACLASSLIKSQDEHHIENIGSKRDIVCKCPLFSPLTRCLSQTSFCSQKIFRPIAQRNQHNFSSENRRQVRKAILYKHYPSSHFTRLRHLRYAFRKIMQRNAKFERRKMSLAKTKMRERGEENMAKMRDIKENIFTVPNILSTSRLLLSPLLGYLVVTEQYMLGTGLFIFTGATDLLDGYIARNFKNQKSVLGSIIDPLADKCLISVLTISLTVSNLIPVPLTALIVARDIGLVGAASYMRYKSLAPPITVSRYFDVSHATVQLKPTFVSKINTAVQLVLVGVTLPAPIFHYVDHISLQYLWYITAATTILSGLSYILSKNTVEFLRTTKRK
ncbi:cardiolipin synthase (CMP-forming)-like isoform X1 [Apostichopus japonicus]|uniref:cardiolipin synthase (CMP-forming)-like isoform X1 n=1 Tax=Stichopus japonicus TaxID=307972 RepID=UPI003AB120F6